MNWRLLFQSSNMKLDRRVLSVRNYHLSQIEFWIQNRNKNKFREQSATLLEALFPVFWIYRIFGLAPYRISKNRLVASQSHLFFSFFALFINTYIGVVTFLQTLEDHSKRPLLTATERGKYILNYATIMIEILIDMSKRKQFLKIWNIIQDFDHKTVELGFPISNKKTKFWVWVSLIVHSLYWLWINQTGMYAFSETVYKNVCYMFLYVGTCISVTKFSGMAIVIGLRFKHLNKIIRKFGPNEIRRKPELNINSEIVEKLRNDLILACNDLNSLYYWSLLLWLFNLSIHAVSCTYLFIELVIRNAETMGLFVYLCLIAWLFVHKIQLVILNSACHFASIEANRMGYIMLNWRRWQSHYNRRKDFEWTLHFMHSQLNFSAGGCCHVNLPLLCSIFGVMTTFLVILLQIPN